MFLHHFFFYYVCLDCKWIHFFGICAAKASTTHFLITHFWKQTFQGQKRQAMFKGIGVFFLFLAKLYTCAHREGEGFFSSSLPLTKGDRQLWGCSQCGVSLLSASTGQTAPYKYHCVYPHSIQPPLTPGIRLDPVKLLPPACALIAIISNKTFLFWT